MWSWTLRTIAFTSLILCSTSLTRAATSSTHSRLSTSVEAESLSVAHGAIQLGQQLMERGDFATAGNQFRRAVAALKEVQKADSQLVTARVWLTGALGESGAYAEAVPLSRDVLAELERHAPPDSATLSLALNYQGRLLTLMGNFKEARLALERALAIRVAQEGELSRNTRITLNNLANVYSRTGDLKSSRPIYERLVLIERAQSPPDSSRLGIYLNNLANATSDLGDLEEGRELYEETLAIRERILGPSHPRLASTLINVSSLAEVMKDDGLALRYLERAIGIYESTLGPTHPSTAELYINRALILRRAGEFDRAFHDALLGERLTREHLRLTARSLPPADALRYEQDRLSGLDLALVLTTAATTDSDRVATALDAVVHSRAVLLDELAARNRVIATSSDSLLSEMERKCTLAREHLSELTLSGMRAAISDSTYGRSLKAAREAAKEAEHRLAQHSSTNMREEKLGRISLAEVRSALPSSGALVSFVRFAGLDTNSVGEPIPEYVAFVLKPGSAPSAIPLGNGTQIDSLIGEWYIAAEPNDHRRRGDEEEVYRRIATSLRLRVWDPILPSLRGVQQVFLVTDGPLHLLSFATLPTAGGKYLVESGPILHYLSTERDLVSHGTEPLRAGSLLIMGGVNYDHSGGLGSSGKHETPAPVTAAAAYRGVPPNCEAFRNLRFLHLDATESECHEVAASWRRGTKSSVGSVPSRATVVPSHAPSESRSLVLTGTEASEEALKRLAPGFGTLHVATHGFFVDPACVVQGDSGEVEETVSNYPLLLSGLVLAGANRHGGTDDGEDGFLTAEEIASLNLSGVGLVTLSACGTGVGTIVSHEGVFGLRRSFELAGAGSVVMSMWRVKDVDASRWMREFYSARTQDHMGTAEAVQHACRASLEDLRRQHASVLPARWGAFIACGGWR